MIRIGLTGWGDHANFYPPEIHKDKLRYYSSVFPIVELDSSFYAILKAEQYQEWIDKTPPSFRFVIKAYGGLTGHRHGKSEFPTIGAMFDAFIASLRLMIPSGKCAMILFQYPPWFDCSEQNVARLRYTKKKMGKLPIAVEFRHPSWFRDSVRPQTLHFLRQEGWIYTICDEPQTPIGSIPLVSAGWGKCVLIRLHGRNVGGWLNHGPNWRKTRCLYRYNRTELEEWERRLKTLEQCTDDIYMIFNNDSGGDAADNAKQMIDLLGLRYRGLAPHQLDLFNH